MNYYGIFLLVICVVGAANGLIDGSALKTLAKNQNECIEETGTSSNDVEYTKQFGKFCKDGHMDKFAACLLKKYNIMKNDGSINQDSESYARNLVTDDPEAYDQVKKCTLLEVSDNYLVSARRVINCILDSSVYVLNPRPKKIT